MAAREDFVSKLISEVKEWWFAFCFMVPGRAGSWLRRRSIDLCASKCGSRLFVAPGTWWNGLNNISIGDNVSIGRGCILESTSGVISLGDNVAFNSNVTLGSDFGEIRIGADVIVGMNVVMRAANHRFDHLTQTPIREQGHEGGKIMVDDDVWIGANVTILSGVTIGSHSVIGAGAVVTKDIPAYSLAYGVPAKVVRKLEAS